MGSLGGIGGSRPAGPPAVSSKQDVQPPSFMPPPGPPPGQPDLTAMPPPGPPLDLASLGAGVLAGAEQAAAEQAKAQAQPELDNKEEKDSGTQLAEYGTVGKSGVDMLQPIHIPKDEELARPVPKQVRALEDGTDIFKLFGVDEHRFDAKAVRKGYHKLCSYVEPSKLGRDATSVDDARHMRLKQAYTVIMDDQLRAIYRQNCYGIAGSGGTAAQGHEAALAKALEMGRELRKLGEERAIVLHKAAETGWSVQQKDADGRKMKGDVRRHAHQFNLFGDISSSEGDEELEKEQRSMTVDQILAKSAKYADLFLAKSQALLCDPKISQPAAGGAFTMHDAPDVMGLLKENPKTVQRHLRRIRASVKQMNWAMTSLLQHKDSPWRGLEVKSSRVEHGSQKLLELVKTGLAFGKFNEVHEEDMSRLVDNIHKLYMDLFERRGQELLRSAITTELAVVYLLPDSDGRVPDGTKVVLQDLGVRADLNGKTGTVTGWDYSLQRYTVEIDKAVVKGGDNSSLPPANPQLALPNMDDDIDEEDSDEEEKPPELAVPKKLMAQPKHVAVDMKPTEQRLEQLVREWNAWRKRPRSVSATQDAEAVAAALGPPLESMASYLQEAAAAVSTAAACGQDGADLTAFACREALQGARTLAAKLLGETPVEPGPAPSFGEPPLNPLVLVPEKEMTTEEAALKLAAEVAQASIGPLALNKTSDRKEGKRGRSRKRSRSRRKRRKRHSSSSSSSSPRDRKKR